MLRPTIVLALSWWTGTTLVLSGLRWFRRPRLVDRLGPYVPGSAGPRRSGVFSVASFHEVLAPLARVIGARMSRLFGVSEDLELRLRRIHSPFDITAFRVRQVGWGALALFGGALASIALDLPAGAAILFVLGGPTLAFLLLEQRVASASAAWQRRVFLELPVVAEQLGMLMSAGWSLSAALDRIATRGSGHCASDLRRVLRRHRQGVTEIVALREWGAAADVAALDRLISVLALNREAADLGRLISDEARSIRRDTQRETIEAIERRSQQVWIPVTVAALVPGVLLMGVPFVDALTLFSTS